MICWVASFFIPCTSLLLLLIVRVFYVPYQWVCSSLTFVNVTHCKYYLLCILIPFYLSDFPTSYLFNDVILIPLMSIPSTFSTIFCLWAGCLVRFMCLSLFCLHVFYRNVKYNIKQTHQNHVYKLLIPKCWWVQACHVCIFMHNNSWKTMHQTCNQ